MADFKEEPQNLSLVHSWAEGPQWKGFIKKRDTTRFSFWARQHWGLCEPKKCFLGFKGPVHEKNIKTFSVSHISPPVQAPVKPNSSVKIVLPWLTKPKPWRRCTHLKLVLPTRQHQTKHFCHFTLTVQINIKPTSSFKLVLRRSSTTNQALQSNYSFGAERSQNKSFSQIVSWCRCQSNQVF